MSLGYSLRIQTLFTSDLWRRRKTQIVLTAMPRRLRGTPHWLTGGVDFLYRAFDVNRATHKWKRSQHLFDQEGWRLVTFKELMEFSPIYFATRYSCEAFLKYMTEAGILEKRTKVVPRRDGHGYISECRIRLQVEKLVEAAENMSMAKLEAHVVTVLDDRKHSDTTEVTLKAEDQGERTKVTAEVSFLSDPVGHEFQVPSSSIEAIETTEESITDVPGQPHPKIESPKLMAGCSVAGDACPASLDLIRSAHLYLGDKARRARTKTTIVGKATFDCLKVFQTCNPWHVTLTWSQLSKMTRWINHPVPSRRMTAERLGRFFRVHALTEPLWDVSLDENWISRVDFNGLVGMWGAIVKAFEVADARRMKDDAFTYSYVHAYEKEGGNMPVWVMSQLADVNNAALKMASGSWGPKMVVDDKHAPVTWYVMNAMEHFDCAPTIWSRLCLAHLNGTEAPKVLNALQAKPVTTSGRDPRRLLIRELLTIKGLAKALIGLHFPVKAWMQAAKARHVGAKLKRAVALVADDTVAFMEHLGKTDTYETLAMTNFRPKYANPA